MRSAREARGWSADYMASMIGAPVDAVLAAENGRGYEMTRVQMRAALEAAGIEFTDGAKPGGVRLAREGT